MRWFRRAPRPDTTPTARAHPDEDDQDDEDALLALADVDLAEPGDDVFVCTTCGRTDLPPAGDWDPPICSECDAAINFDALLESGHYDDR
ncbi:MAG: hypothetical protein V2B17_04345 [Chloroflexota bacterium]